MNLFLGYGLIRGCFASDLDQGVAKKMSLGVYRLKGCTRKYYHNLETGYKKFITVEFHLTKTKMYTRNLC